MIHRTDDHLPFRWLADLHDGLLPADRAAEAHAHLAAGCAPCAARRDSIRRMVAAIADGAPERAPADVDRRVVAALSRARAAARPAAVAEVPTLVGELVLDQRLDLALAVRSSGADARRILWRVGPWDVDASVVARDGRSDLLGQFVHAGDDDAPVSGEVRVVRSRRVVARSPVAADGRFTFRRLAPGPCVLEGTVAGRAFALPPLVID